MDSIVKLDSLCHEDTIGIFMLAALIINVLIPSSSTITEQQCQNVDKIFWSINIRGGISLIILFALMYLITKLSNKKSYWNDAALIGSMIFCMALFKQLGRFI
jgi:hypothetical protein